ncbi:MAG: hypothetical protein WCE68_08200 [Anaerolineales bacterium]
MSDLKHVAPCDDIIILKEKVAALEAWKSATEADLKAIRDVVSQVKLLMSFSLGGGAISLLTLIFSMARFIMGK